MTSTSAMQHECSSVAASEQTAAIDRKKSRSSGRAANNLRHGRHSLTLGALGGGYEHITRTVNGVRVQLEASVVADRGEISLHDAAVIQTCCRFERHAQLAGKWLRENPGLPVEVRLAISRDIAKASSERDRCIRLLGLDKRANDDPWAELHRVPAIPNAGEDAEAVQSDLDSPAGHLASQTTGGEQCCTS